MVSKSNRVTRPEPRTAPCAVICRGDGSVISAIIDPHKWPHEGGVAGFGDTLPDALRDLALSIEKEVGYDSVNDPCNLVMLGMLLEELNRIRVERLLPTSYDMARIYAIMDAQ